jgi:ribose transport system substrate-binding protein
MNRRRSRFAMRLVAAVASAALVAACSSSPGATTASSGKNAAPKVAFFAYLKGNAFDDSIYAGMQAELKTLGGGGAIQYFSSNTSATTQLAQITDAIQSKAYNVFVVHADDAVSIMGAVSAAEKQGIKVIAVWNPLGPNLNTAQPQLSGLSGSVVTPVNKSGLGFGQLIIDACAHLSPCQVEYMPGNNAEPLEIDRTNAVLATVKGHANIHMLPMVQGGYTPTSGNSATLSVLSSHPDVQVLAGSDQAIYGAQLALQTKNLLGKIKLIGGGGSTQAVQGVRSGKWFGDQLDCPYTYGVIATKIGVAEVRGQQTEKYVDASNSCGAPNAATKANMGSFQGQYSAI